MKILKLTLLAASVFCLTLLATSLPTSYRSQVNAAPATTDVGCDSGTCHTTGGRRLRRCPKCQNDHCVLKCENGKVKKNGFNVDQKVICIPPVTWPWQKQPKKCAKTRTVNVLKRTKYECSECKYSWSVQEPMIQQLAPSGQQLQPQTGSGSSQRIEQPGYEQQLYDPAGSDIPTPRGSGTIGSGSSSR